MANQFAGVGGVVKIIERTIGRGAMVAADKNVRGDDLVHVAHRSGAPA
jgi:hypothetical protein